MNLLREGAVRLGFDLSAEQLQLFQRYYELLVEWNARTNLTAITEYDAVQVRHFLDSLSVGAVLRGLAGQSAPRRGMGLVDLGAGAGFPGVPLKIVWPQIALTLADSVGKKTAFLRALVDALGLSEVDVVTARAEEMGQDRRHRERYDAVTARAVASLPVLLEYCMPLTKVGGWGLFPKKGDISPELRGAERGAKLVGGGMPLVRDVHLPGEDEGRVIVAVRKERATPPGYPRRVGLAKARPLGSG